MPSTRLGFNMRSHDLQTVATWTWVLREKTRSTPSTACVVEEVSSQISSAPSSRASRVEAFERLVQWPFHQDAEPARRPGGNYVANLCEDRFVDSVGRETGVTPVKTMEIIAKSSVLR